LGTNTNKKQTLEIAKEVGQKAMEDLVGPGEGPMNFALALAPRHIEKLVNANLIPQKGATETIAAYKERSAERAFLPKAKGHNLLGGFSYTGKKE
jgi:hypothetical protein